MAAQTEQPARGSRVQFGLFEADLAAGELRRSGVRVRLQAQPFRILSMLLERPGEIVTREEIEQRLWGSDTIVDFDHSLGTAINKIRDALGDSAENPRFIETLAKRGYRFLAPVSPVEATAEAGAAASAQPGAEAAPAHRHWLYSKWTIGAAAVIVAGVLAFLAGRHTGFHPALPPLITQVTYSGRVSPGDPQLESLPGMATDGSRLYFSEIENGRSEMAEALIDDGQTSPLAVPSEIAAPSLGDISPDGSQLLLRNHLSTGAEQPLWIVPTLGGEARQIPGILAHDATWMPDGQHVLYATGHELWIINQDGTGKREFATVPGRAFWLRWSPNGSTLRFTLLNSEDHTTALWQMDAQGRNAHPLLPGWTTPPAECCGSWTADGRYYVFQATRNGSTNLWRIDERPGLFGSRKPVPITNGPLSYQAPIPAQSGDRVFFIGLNTRSELLSYDAAARQFVPYLGFLSNAQRVAFSPDQQWVAWIQQDDGSLWRSRVDGSQRVQLIARPMQVFMMQWSPDGQHLVLMGREPGQPWRVYEIDRDGGNLRPLLKESRNEADPGWSPDGKTIVFGRLPALMAEVNEPKSIELLDLATGKVSELPGSEGLFSPRWSPDGRYIAALSLDQTKMMLYDTTTGKWRQIAQANIADPVWSRNGKAIFFNNFVQQGQPIYRLTIATGQLERVAGLSDLRSADAVDYRFAGLGPGNVPLVNVRLSTANIYSTVLR